MELTKIIEALIGIGGLIIGATYITGGLIVNLHLARFGITEYQILRVKYLVVGLTYLTNFIAILFLAAIPALFVALSDLLIQQVFLIASLLASVCLLWLWGRSVHSAQRRKYLSWRLWALLGTVASIYPIMAIIRLVLMGQVTYESAVTVAQAFLAGILSFVGQIYFYARHLYGRENSIFGSVDPIGMGIPVQVQLAGEGQNIALLVTLGIPIVQPETTDKILLIDETDSHYIVGVTQEGRIRGLKVAKEIIKAILYC